MTFTSSIVASASGTTATVDVDLQGANPISNLLDAWIDFNRDGDWSDPGEQIFSSESLGTTNGVQSLTFNVPADSGSNVLTGETYARFRLSSEGGLAATGLGLDGEVEDYRVSVIGPPTVESTQVNAGADHRSTVSELTVTFDREVNAPGSAFILTNRDTNAPINSIVVTSTVIANKTVNVVTFATGDGIGTHASGLHSLMDGNYQLRIDSCQITSVDGGASMTSDHLFGNQESDAFFRWFGDSDGDRDVDGEDYARFRLSLLKSVGDSSFNPALDFDGDGDVDGQDFGKFRRRFLSRVDF